MLLELKCSKLISSMTIEGQFLAPILEKLVHWMENEPEKQAC